jgi:hypothetical protein
MAGLGRKIFTAGDVLTASDVQSFLMDQTVMNFAGTAARSSAIATPTQGMVSYRDDIDNLELYNGSAWVSASGLQLIKKQTIGSAVASVNVTGAFSSTYDSYKIIVSGGAGALNSNISLTFGATFSNYKWNLIYAQYTGTSNLTLTSGGVSGASFAYAGASSTNTINAEIDVNNPFLSKNTHVRATFLSPTESGQLLGFLDNSTSYTDFTLSVGGTTMTGGTIYVYGYGK